MKWLIDNWDIISVLVCFFMYSGTCAVRWYKGDLPMALTFVAYAVANLGFIWHFWNSRCCGGH